MIPKDKIYKLIAIYLYICDLYESELKHLCQRFSNNSAPDFTDQEVLTIYLFVMHTEQKLKLNQIHLFAKDYMLSWFPRLPSYEAFIMRINRLSEALKHIANDIFENQCPNDCCFDTSLLDSLPIITCSGKRKGVVAKEITDKGYCSSKNMYYLPWAKTTCPGIPEAKLFAFP